MAKETVNNVSVLPAHIAFSQSIKGDIDINLSHSCGQSLSVGSLLSYCDGNRPSLAQLDLSYASVKGSKELRHSIVAYHQAVYEQSWLKAKHVTTFSGAQEALRAIYQALLGSGDEVIVFTPSYPSLQSMVGEMGANIVPIALDYQTGWQIDMQALERAFNANTKLVVINSPHNPTGATFTDSQLEQVLAWCEQHDSYLLLDEVSQATQYQKASAKRTLNDPRIIFVNVMSKSLGLAGIRLGWTICRDAALRNALIAQKTKGSICTSAIDEYFAQLALENYGRILARNNAIVEENIALFNAFVNEHSWLSWHAPKAGLLATVKFDVAILGENSMLDWAKQFTEATGVLLLPTSLFGLDGPYCRFGLGQKNFSQGIQRLAQYVAKQ